MTLLDKAMVVVYRSWVLPHLILAWIGLRYEQFVPRAALRLAVAYHLTTPFYWLVPTAPPWWASEAEGKMGGEVERVLRHVIRDIRHKPRAEADESPGNPWGSMPSDHIASAAITAMALSEVGGPSRAVGWTYVALASISVVYLGEHYLVDVIVGPALAEAIRLGEPRVAPAVRRLAWSLERRAT